MPATAKRALQPNHSHDKTLYGTPSEASRTMRIPIAVIRRWVREGAVAMLELPGCRPMVVLADLERLIKESIKPGKSQAATQTPTRPAASEDTPARMLFEA